MEGIIVFNSVNDVIYWKFNSILTDHIYCSAIRQGFLVENGADKTDRSIFLDQNIILQFFCPLINSQRIMQCQFDNIYTSIQCENDLNLVFANCFDYQFIKLAQKPVDELQRNLGISISIIRRLLGPILFSANSFSGIKEDLFNRLAETYQNLVQKCEQSFMLESLPALLISTDLRKMVVKCLDIGLERWKSYGHKRVHLLLFVADKFVALNSDKKESGIGMLSNSDLMFLALWLKSLEKIGHRSQNSLVAYLEGGFQHPNLGCVPCLVHATHLERNTNFVQIIEFENMSLSHHLQDSILAVQKLIITQTQNDVDAIKPNYENLEASLRQSLDILRKYKLKTEESDLIIKKLSTKLNNLRKIYQEFQKNYDHDVMLRLEANLSPLMIEIRKAFALICSDYSNIDLNQLPKVASIVEGKLLELFEFLAVKAERNISIDAYLEDFPGLVHFVYINRSSGLMVAPDLKNPPELIPREKLLSMIAIAREFLQHGQNTIMWKDTSFNYAYFLWFEEMQASTKPINLHEIMGTSLTSKSSFRPQFSPGTMAGDYYQLLIEACFPKSNPNKVKCYELFCVHLGLATATCVMEHARRLVATISDVGAQETF